MYNRPIKSYKPAMLSIIRRKNRYQNNNNVPLVSTLMSKILKFLALTSAFVNCKLYLPKRMDFTPKGFEITKVRLEASSMCQLNCPLCITGLRKTKDSVIGWGYLSFKNFKNFIHKHPKIKSIELSNYGEIFLNPELKEILKYAYKRKIMLSADNGVNFNSISDSILRSIVKYKMRSISISIDGATQETYSKYRINGDLNTVLKNIEKVNQYKLKFNSKYPKLKWQLIIMGLNEHEISISRKLAAKLNMAFKTKLNWNDSFSPVINKSKIQKQTNLQAVTRKEYEQKTGKTYLSVCQQLWQQPQINWDGELLGCCINYWQSFGNVFKDGLKKTMNSERYRYAKKMILGKARKRADIPCSHCSICQERPVNTPVA